MPKPATLAMLQGLVANEGDGWKWTLEELDRYFETCAPVTVSPETITESWKNPRGPFRTPDFSTGPGPCGHLSRICRDARASNRRVASGAGFTDGRSGIRAGTADGRRILKLLLADLRQHASGVFDLLKERVSYLPDEVVEIAASVLEPASPDSGSFHGLRIG